MPANNPRTGRTGKLRASHFGLRHQNPLRRTRQKPSFNGGRFPSFPDNSLSRNIAFQSNGGHGVSSSGVRRNKISSQGYGDKFRPSIKLPSTFVTISHPIATVASLQTPTPSTNNYISSTTSLPTVSLITGRPIQFTLDPVYSNASVGERNTYNRPSRSYPSATVTGRPSTPSINNNKNIVITKTKQELQNNVVIPIGAASGFTDNVITDDKTEIISLKNIESKFKTFKAVNFFDQSKPSSDIKLFIPEQNTQTENVTHAFERSVVGEPVISFVDELEASASSPSLFADNPTPVSTPRMFNEILDIVAVSTSRPAAFDGQRFIKELGPYPDVFATSSPSPAPSPFPIRNNNQQLTFSTQKPRPTFQNSQNPTTKPVFQNSNTNSVKPTFQNSNTFQNTLDSPSVSGPNPNSNGASIRFPVEAFRNSAVTNGRPQSQKEPLSEDLLNLVNSLRGRINGNQQQPRQPKNNKVQSGGRRKKNKKKNKNKKKQKKQQKESRSGKQQNRFANAIQLISSSSLDGRLGRQAAKFGPNSAGPVVEGFPAGLPAATPEGVKIALSSPLGKCLIIMIS